MRFGNRFALSLAVTATVAVLAALALLPARVSATAQDAGPSKTAEGSAAAVHVVAYYFHGNARCKTCRTIEQYSHEAITAAFTDDLANGRLEWRVVNVDEDENKHFIQDFQLVTRSLVLAEHRGNQVARWKNLDQVWRLVRDKEGFIAYVQEQTSAFLDAK